VKINPHATHHSYRPASDIVQLHGRRITTLLANASDAGDKRGLTIYTFSRVSVSLRHAYLNYRIAQKLFCTHTGLLLGLFRLLG